MGRMAEAPSCRTVIHRLVAQHGVDRITDGILASFVDRPDFASLSPPRGDLRVWVRWNVEVIVRWFEGQPPTEGELDRFRELGRICAANGTPPDAIPANYRLGSRYAWAAVVQAADPHERAVLVDGVDVILEFVDRISSVYAAAYEAAARSSMVCAGAGGPWAAGATGWKSDLVPEDRNVADAVGFDLNGPFVAFVVCWPGRRRHADHTRAARRLLGLGALAAPHGRRVIGVADRGPLVGATTASDQLLAQSRCNGRSDLGAVLDDLERWLRSPSRGGTSDPWILMTTSRKSCCIARPGSLAASATSVRPA